MSNFKARIMQLCTYCASELIPGAKFCHRCGENIIEQTKDCPVCHTASPLASVFCHNCRYHFDGKEKNKAATYLPAYPLEFNPDTLTEQVKALFFKSLRFRVEEELEAAQYTHYVERFYQSNFKNIYEARAEQISEDILMHWERFGAAGLPELDRMIEDAFEGLLDYFIIQFCPDLNGVILPPVILRYEKAQAARTDLGLMVRDYLNFEQENDLKLYFDFIRMPETALNNAIKYFLHADKGERVFFVCDMTLKGTCREGFALTDKGIYWRNSFEKPRKVLYKDLRELKRQKQWVLINGNFFSVNPCFNLKMLKLLKKLRAWSALPKPAAQSV